MERTTGEWRGKRNALRAKLNNAYGGAELLDDLMVHRPFWEHSLGHWDTLFTGGLRNHLVASRLAVPLMLNQRRGPIVTTSCWARKRRRLANVSASALVEG